MKFVLGMAAVSINFQRCQKVVGRCVCGGIFIGVGDELESNVGDKMVKELNWELGVKLYL